MNPSEEGSTLKKKQLAPNVRKFFPFRIDPFPEGGKTNSISSSPKSVFSPLNNLPVWLVCNMVRTGTIYEQGTSSQLSSYLFVVYSTAATDCVSGHHRLRLIRKFLVRKYDKGHLFMLRLRIDLWF